MQWFFGTKETQEDEPIQDELQYPFLKQCIYQDDDVSFYKTDARDFVNYIYNAKFQRKVDLEHVRKLKEELYESKHCVGTFKAVQHNDNKVELIDGQHRVLALHQLMLDDAKFNMNLFLEVYSSHNQQEHHEWFRRANNVKNFEEEDLPNIKVEEIMTLLTNTYKDSIVNIKITSKEKSVYRPKVDAQLLSNTLKKYIDEHHIVDGTLLFKQIEKLNNEAGMKKRGEFKQVTEKMWEKAKESGFYLGLYQNFSWVNQL